MMPGSLWRSISAKGRLPLSTWSYRREGATPSPAPGHPRLPSYRHGRASSPTTRSPAQCLTAPPRTERRCGTLRLLEQSAPSTTPMRVPTWASLWPIGARQLSTCNSPHATRPVSRGVYMFSLNPFGHTAFNLSKVVAGLPANFTGTITIEPTDNPLVPFLAWSVNVHNGLLSPLPPGEMLSPRPWPDRFGNAPALVGQARHRLAERRGSQPDRGQSGPTGAATSWGWVSSWMTTRASRQVTTAPTTASTSAWGWQRP